jgi:hypothetical protein
MENANKNCNGHELTSNPQDTDQERKITQEESSMTAEGQRAEGGETGMWDESNKEYKPAEKWRIMKNIVVISLAFMVHFTAFQGAGNLQSSVNADEGLGTVSLATIYFSLILSNVFLPVVMIRLVVYISILILTAIIRVLSAFCKNTTFLVPSSSLACSIIIPRC